MKDQELRDRVEELEGALCEYAEWLEEAIQQRDRLAVDAAWGVVQSLNYLVGYLGPILIILWAEWGEWWQIVLALIASTILGPLLSMRANEKRMKEVERLATLPDWRKMKPKGDVWDLP